MNQITQVIKITVQLSNKCRNSLFVILVVLEEIYQAGKQINLWKIEECVVNIDSAVIKLEELVWIFHTNLIPAQKLDWEKIKRKPYALRNFSPWKAKRIFPNPSTLSILP